MKSRKIEDTLTLIRRPSVDWRKHQHGRKREQRRKMYREALWT